VLRFVRPPQSALVELEQPRPVDGPAMPLGVTTRVVNPRVAAAIPPRPRTVAPPGYPPPNIVPVRPTAMARLSYQPSGYLHYLPPCYHDSDLANAILLACEAVLDPIERMIDQIDAYFHPATAPRALLPWLAAWVDVVLDETLPIERQRALVSAAADLYRRRGTRGGLRDYLRLYTGVEPTIVEPGEEHGETNNPPLRPNCFRVFIPLEASQVNRAILEAIIEAEKPAHTAYDLRFGASDSRHEQIERTNKQ
jgi:phage tail-like protein